MLLKSPFEGMSATFQYKAPKKRTMVQNIVESKRASQDFSCVYRLYYKPMDLESKPNYTTKNCVTNVALMEIKLL